MVGSRTTQGIDVNGGTVTSLPRASYENGVISLVSKMWKHISEKNDDVEACFTMLRMGREPSSKR